MSTEANLEETKAHFIKIDAVDLFALHKDPIDDISTIMSYDHIEDERFFRSDSGRAGIKTLSVLNLYFL